MGGFFKLIYGSSVDVNMRTILSADGGGTKLRMILFNEKFDILGQGLAGGVNVNSTTPENSMENVKTCLDQVFGRNPPPLIDRLYAVFVGPVTNLLNAIKDRTKLKEAVFIPEAEAGLMAGAFWEEGFLALSGTGSDIFLVDKKGRLKARDGKARKVTGGWGPILGDQGSGVWIGQEAVRAVVSGIEGWTEKTFIHDLIQRDWKLKEDWDMVPIVYGEPAPFRKVASLTRQVEEAAAAGDAAALRIVREAGELMAIQGLSFFARFDIPPDMRRLVCCGGAWKTHPLMFETFKQKILAEYPGFDIRKPLFEHLMAGPAFEILRQGVNVSRAAEILAEKFPDLVITW
jgi:N-acetylglucosamine kinase-like BadF-type ATPase